LALAQPGVKAEEEAKAKVENKLRVRSERRDVRRQILRVFIVTSLGKGGRG
jgi:hypothetical protein